MYRCAICSTVREGPIEPSATEGYGFAHCRTCGIRTAHRLMEPVARATDPETSWEAAKSVTKVRHTQRLILRLLTEQGPMTDEMIAAALRTDGVVVSPSGARTRRAELVDMGLIRDSGRKALMSTGRRAIVWAAVQAGEQAA